MSDHRKPTVPDQTATAPHAGNGTARQPSRARRAAAAAVAPWRHFPAVRTKVAELVVQDARLGQQLLEQGVRASQELVEQGARWNRELIEQGVLLRQELAELRGEIARNKAELAAYRQHTARQLRMLIRSSFYASPMEVGSLAPREDRMDLDACFRQLERLAPYAFAAWKELLEVNSHAYEGFPLDSCSVAGHPMAQEFCCFLWPYLQGAVLDIGCGPQPTPCYLRDYPSDRIAGIDPLPPADGHPFVYVQTVAEFLPWNDKTFSAVVIATSLDHVLLLDRALAEIHRVLRDEGHLVVWLDHIPGAAKYDPYRPDVEKIDDFHLFHFDRPWFEEIMNQRFAIDEMAASSERSYFYAFRPRGEMRGVS
jgi:SAM-dependent methyltransferase